MPCHKTTPAVRAFTLPEMLVSIAVLVVLVILVSRLLGSATSVIATSGKRSDSDIQARMIFDRMSADFGAILRRQDVDYLFAKQGGNDTMYFYSQAPGYFDSTLSDTVKSPITLVGYRVNANLQLERLGKGLTWDGAAGGSTTTPGSVIFLTPSGSTTPLAATTIAGNWASTVGAAPGYNNGTAAEYHVLGDQVYRLEVSFVQTTGAVTNSTTSYNGLRNVSAVSVALALLDTTSRALVTQNGTIPTATATQMVAALPDAVVGTPTMQSWKASTYLMASGVPQGAASHLRIYERAFFLNTD